MFEDCRRNDGTKRRQGEGKEWKEICEDWTRKQRKTPEKTHLSWGCWQFSKRKAILTCAARRDVEMADPGSDG